MNKKVKDILTEFQILMDESQLAIISDISTSADMVTSLMRNIANTKEKGLTFEEENRGWMKSYFSKEVVSLPKLIKDGSNIMGVAIPIGDNGGIPDYITYIKTNNGYVFAHTYEPTKYEYERKTFPKKLLTKQFQLGISPFLTHILDKSTLDMLFEKHDYGFNRIGTIRTRPENYCIAVVMNDNSLVFDVDAAIKDIVNQAVITDMWKRGIIFTKNENE